MSGGIMSRGIMSWIPTGVTVSKRFRDVEAQMYLGHILTFLGRVMSLVT